MRVVIDRKSERTGAHCLNAELIASSTDYIVRGVLECDIGFGGKFTLADPDKVVTETTLFDVIEKTTFFPESDCDRVFQILHRIAQFMMDKDKEHGGTAPLRCDPYPDYRTFLLMHGLGFSDDGPLGAYLFHMPSRDVVSVVELFREAHKRFPDTLAELYDFWSPFNV